MYIAIKVSVHGHKEIQCATVPANELCVGIHNGGKNPFRMPLIIGKENENLWLDNTL